MAKIPKKVQQRLGKAVPAFQKVLKEARDRDVNEADTVTIITDMLSEIFGFDKYAEITGEFAIRNTYCDLAVVMEADVKLLIEVKAIGINLKENHLRQVVNYGATHGIQWVVLTNGLDWEVYSLKFEKPISYQLLCKFNMLELSPRASDDQSLLLLLSKEGLLKNLISQYQNRVNLINRFTLAGVIQSEPVLNMIRREIRRLNKDLKIEVEEIEELLEAEVLKRDLIQGERVEKAAKKVKRASDKSLRTKRKPKEVNDDADLVGVEARKGY